MDHQDSIKEVKLGRPLALTEKAFPGFVEDAMGVLGPKDTKITHYKGPLVEIYPICLLFEPPEIPEVERWEHCEELAFEGMRRETPTRHENGKKNGDKLTGKWDGDSQIYIVFDGNARYIAFRIPHNGGVSAVYAFSKEKALYLGKEEIIGDRPFLESHLYVRADPGCKDVRDISMVRTSLFPVPR